MMIIEKMQEVVKNFKALQFVEEQDILDFEDKLSTLVRDYLNEVERTESEVITVVDYYFSTFSSGYIKDQFYRHSLQLDGIEFCKGLRYKEDIIIFHKLFLTYNRDLVIYNLRKYAEYFQGSEGREQRRNILDYKEKIQSEMLYYVEEQEGFYEALCTICGERVDPYDLGNTITQTYNSFKFFCCYFRLNYYLEQIGEEACEKGVLPHVSKFINGRDIIDFNGGDSMESYMSDMFKIADSFNESRSNHTWGYVEETMEKLKDIVTDCLFYKSIDEPGNCAAVFDSFLYLCDKNKIFKSWRKYTEEDFDFGNIYSYCQNESLIPYLKCLKDKDYEGALVINNDYEIAHYHLLLEHLMAIGDTLENVGKLSEETSKDIYLHYSHMGEIYILTDRLASSEYLENAFDSEYTCVNFEDVLSILSRENKLREKNAQLEELNKALQEAIDAKNEMIDRHAHNWKHISYPSTVKEVAEKLAGDENYKSYANKLFKAYNSENILKQEVLMLKLKHSGSSEDMQKQIISDVLLPTARTGISIEKIIEDSLDLVLFRILMEDVDTSIYTEAIKENLSKFKDLQKLRENYSNHFIVKESNGVSLMDWFRQNIYSIDISTDENWRAVKVKKDSTAYAQLVEIFIDLFHNAINYGRKDDEGYIKIELKSDKLEDVDYLTLKISNPVDYGNVLEKGTNQGLSSMKKLLEKLNYIPGRGEKAIPSVEAGLDSEDSNCFSTKIYFKQRLLLKR